MDDRYTRPQGLYDHDDVDLKKLKRLIVKGKLAPCYPGKEVGDDAADDDDDDDDDDDAWKVGSPKVKKQDLDECPICFLSYPSLNHSKCCNSGICTECFLQLKAPARHVTVQCPFCKTPSYSVQFRGCRTDEERAAAAEEEAAVAAAEKKAKEHELQRAREREARRQEKRAAMALGDDAEETSTDFESAPTSPTTPNRRGEGSRGESDIPEGWEEEYAAMTPQRANPAAARSRRSTPASAGTRPTVAGAISGRTYGDDHGRAVSLGGERASDPGVGGGREEELSFEMRAASAAAMADRRGSRSRRRRDLQRDIDAAVDEDERAAAGGAEPAGARNGNGAPIIGRRSRRLIERDPPATEIDPSFLRMIQDYVPERLLNSPSTVDANGRTLDMEDMMVMEAMWLSLRDQENEEERRQQREAAAADEAAELEAAIRAIADAEGAATAPASAPASATATASSGDGGDARRADEGDTTVDNSLDVSGTTNETSAEAIDADADAEAIDAGTNPFATNASAAATDRPRPRARPTASVDDELRRTEETMQGLLNALARSQSSEVFVSDELEATSDGGGAYDDDDFEDDEDGEDVRVESLVAEPKVEPPPEPEPEGDAETDEDDYPPRPPDADEELGPPPPRVGGRAAEAAPSTNPFTAGDEAR